MLTSTKLLRYGFILFGIYIAYAGMMGINQRFSPVFDSDDKKMREQESLETAMAAVAKALSPDSKKRIERDLLTSLQSSTVENKYKIIKFLSYLDIAGDELESYLIRVLQDPLQENLYSVSMKYLARQKSQWLSENLNVFLTNSSDFVRLVALGVLLDLCPVDATNLLEQFLIAEKNLQLKNYAFKIKSKLDLCESFF